MTYAGVAAHVQSVRPMNFDSRRGGGARYEGRVLLSRVPGASAIHRHGVSHGEYTICRAHRPPTAHPSPS